MLAVNSQKNIQALSPVPSLGAANQRLKLSKRRKMEQAAGSRNVETSAVKKLEGLMSATVEDDSNDKENCYLPPNLRPLSKRLRALPRAVCNETSFLPSKPLPQPANGSLRVLISCAILIFRVLPFRANYCGIWLRRSSLVCKVKVVFED